MSDDKRTARDHTFDTIVGQDLVKQFLIRAVDRGELSQAVMFLGPEGVGKRSLMFALAKHIVSGGADAGSDAARLAAQKVARLTHPDVLVVEPTSASGQILKAQVEQLHERAHYAPLESPSRIIIIHPIEALNPTASNKLLKILEEPPQSLRLLVGCCQPNRTLPTILSRCAILRCPPVDAGALSEWLAVETRCSRRRALAAAHLSGGKPGLALDLVSGEDHKRRRNLFLEMKFFEKQGYPSIFRVGNRLVGNAEDSEAALSALLFWFRDVLVARLTADCGEDGALDEEALREDLLMNRDLLVEIAEYGSGKSVRGLAKVLEVVLRRMDYAGLPFVDKDLLFEVLLTEIGLALKAA